MQYTILYVDDERINLELFKAVFFMKYNIHLAESGSEGLQILENQKVDLLITDQKMPKMTGLEFLSKVSDKYPEIPPFRILTSAYGSPDEINIAIDNYKIHKFIPKPWRVKELVKVVDDIFS